MPQKKQQNLNRGHFNHDKLNQNQLTEPAKGVKFHPVLNIEHKEHNVDAAHAKINIGKFIYKLLTHEIAEVFSVGRDTGYQALS